LSAVASLTGITVTLTGLMLNDQGVLSPFSVTVAPGGARAAARTTQQIGEGWIVHFALRLSGPAVRRGQCYASVWVLRGASALGFQTANLWSGYLATDLVGAFPHVPAEGPLSGQGIPRAVNQANPAAATEWVMTVPAGARWQLQGVTFTLVTSATVLNRFVSLTIDDGANTILRASTNTAQGAAITRIYSFGSGLPNNADTTNNLVSVPFPPVLMFQGWRLRSQTFGLDAVLGDQLQTIWAGVQEWLEL
jgi:hypothetical protein